MSGAECLARLRADAAALSPRAAHIALALLPAVDHLPDAYPEWVVTDPEHPKARELIVNAWQTAQRFRSGPTQPSA